MKTLTYLAIFGLLAHSTPVFSQAPDQKTPVVGVVYRTGMDMRLYVDDFDNDPNNDELVILPAGYKYQLLYEKDDRNYIKVFKITDSIRKGKSDFVNSDNDEAAYYVRDADYFDINKLKTRGLTTGTLLLPIKLRPAITVDSTQYTRQLSTDITLGQYIGYRIPLSKREARYFTVAATFGPTLINLNSDNTQGRENASTPLGVAWSLGAIVEINRFQIGFIYGQDYGFGDISKDWIYDGQGWFSLGVGLRFINPD